MAKSTTTNLQQMNQKSDELFSAATEYGKVKFKAEEMMEHARARLLGALLDYCEARNKWERKPNA